MIEDVTESFVREIAYAPLPQQFRNIKPATSMTPARRRVIDKIDGMKLGLVSKAPIYDRELERSLSRVEHKTLIAMLKGGMVHLFRMSGPLPGDHPASRIGAHEIAHYELRAASRPNSSDWDRVLLPQIDKLIDEGGGWAAIKTLPGGKDYVWDLIDRGVLEEDGGYVRRTRRNARKPRTPRFLREMETPTVLGYELERESLTPVRKTVDPSAPGDYGADVIGDGMFRMVPSGDIVDFEERERRLSRFRQRRNGSDLPRAENLFEKFHQFEPNKVARRPDLDIPPHLTHVGEAKVMYYASDKLNPETGEDEGWIHYFHEHEGGVKFCAVEPESDGPEVTVPDFIRKTTALVRIGDCEGFEYEDHDGRTVEAEGTGRLPEWYATPDGRALLVVQDKRHLIACLWGGDLNVRAEGVVG